MYQKIGSNSMKVVEMISQALITRNMPKYELATKMGWSPQSFSNRMRKSTIDAEEFIKIASFLDYEVQLVDKRTNIVMTEQRKSSGPRVVQMIDGYSYDTDRADSLCHSPKVYGGWFELFRDLATGQFFTVAYLETGGSACVALISKENAKQFYSDCGGEGAPAYFD